MSVLLCRFRFGGVIDMTIDESIECERNHRLYNKALNDIESEFLMCDKVHYNLQDILCVINNLKAGGKNETN